MRGHVTKRGKDSWTIVLSLGNDPETGKRKQKWVSVKGNKKTAEARLVELVHQIDTGSLSNPAKLTLAEFLERWLKDYVAMGVRASTAEGYRIIVEKHLVLGLGGILLSQLTPFHLQGYYAKALKEGHRGGKGGLSARTVLHHHRVLSEALAHAVKWGLVGGM